MTEPARISDIDWEAQLIASMFHDVTTLHYAKDRKLHHIAGAKNAFLFIRDNADLFKQIWQEQEELTISDDELQSRLKALQRKTVYLIVRHDGLWNLTPEKLRADLVSYRRRTDAKLMRIQTSGGIFVDAEQFSATTSQVYLPPAKPLPNELADFYSFISEVEDMLHDGFFEEDNQASFEAELFYVADKMDGLELKDRILLLDVDSRIFFNPELSLEERLKVYSSEYKFHYNHGIDRIGIGLYGLLYKLNPDNYQTSVGRDYFENVYSARIQTNQFLYGLSIMLPDEQTFLQAVKSSYDIVSNLLGKTRLGKAIEIQYDKKGRPLPAEEIHLWNIGPMHRESLLYIQQKFLEVIQEHEARLKHPITNPNAFDEFEEAFEQARFSGDSSILFNGPTPIEMLLVMRSRLASKLQSSLNGNMPVEQKFRIIDYETLFDAFNNGYPIDMSIPTVVIVESSEEYKTLSSLYPTINVSFMLLRKGRRNEDFQEFVEYIGKTTLGTNMEFIVQLGKHNQEFIRYFNRNNKIAIDTFRLNLRSLKAKQLMDLLDSIDSALSAQLNYAA